MDRADVVMLTAGRVVVTFRVDRRPKTQFASSAAMNESSMVVFCTPVTPVLLSVVVREVLLPHCLAPAPLAGSS